MKDLARSPEGTLGAVRRPKATRGIAQAPGRIYHGKSTR